MASLSELTGLGSGSAFAPKLSTPFFSSGTYVAPQDGIVEIRAMGAGGGGAAANSSVTGGYSGAWGAKLLRVAKGQSITVAVGAGGASRTGNVAGNPGGNTTITVAGVAYVAPGGLGGVYAASGTPTVPNGTTLPSTWDIGAGSVKPGTSNIRTGGAGVDILAQGNNATTSFADTSGSGSGGGGTGSASTGASGGGALPGGFSALGTAPASPAEVFDASSGEWLLSFYGGSGGSTWKGGNGGGGAGGVSNGHGGNGGGGGSAGSSGIAGNGGIGGGGGAGTTSGAGGNGFAVIHFYTDSGV